MIEPQHAPAEPPSLSAPQWIARLYPPKSGLDHLGLGSVSSDQILPMLAPGVYVLTVHPRYLSFYSFLLWEYWRRQLPASPDAWERFFRPRDYIYALASLTCQHPGYGDMRNIVASRVVGPHAEEQRDAYPTPFDGYIKNRFGGYGLYYRSVLAELGLLLPGGRGLPFAIDCPTDKGSALAADFGSAVGHTRYIREYFDRDEAIIPGDVIREFGESACPCRLALPHAADREAVRDTLLHGGSAAPERRATFRMLLEIADQTQGTPVDESSFRQLVYFRASNNNATFTPAPHNQDTWRRWRLYQAREYQAFALNALWCYLSDWGIGQQGDLRPLPLAALWNHLIVASNMDPLATSLGLPSPGIGSETSVRGLLDWLVSIAESDESNFDEACGINATINEHVLYVRAISTRRDGWAPHLVASMLVMLCLVYLRFGRPELWSQPEWEIACKGDDDRLSLALFVRELDNRMRAGSFTVGTMARWIFEDHIILQHLLVATRKLPEDTFRFQREDSRLRFFRHDDGVSFMNSRFDALATTLHDLGFCPSLNGTDHTLSPDGRRLLLEGNLP